MFGNNLGICIYSLNCKKSVKSKYRLSISDENLEFELRGYNTLVFKDLVQRK